MSQAFSEIDYLINLREPNYAFILINYTIFLALYSKVKRFFDPEFIKYVDVLNFCCMHQILFLLCVCLCMFSNYIKLILVNIICMLTFDVIIILELFLDLICWFDALTPTGMLILPWMLLNLFSKILQRWTNFGFECNIRWVEKLWTSLYTHIWTMDGTTDLGCHRHVRVA